MILLRGNLLRLVKELRTSNTDLRNRTVNLTIENEQLKGRVYEMEQTLGRRV